ncbi:MAG: sodium/proline symporter [Parachlamydia sp.]|nr:sodium/proline symporter [Parachlamydia sp.]
MDPQILTAFLAYFLVLLTIGILSYRKQRTDSDFIVGNRSLNFWVIALSAHASDMSSWLFMGFPTAIMLRGLPQSWIAIGLLFGMFLNWQLIAKKLRIATEKLESYTLSTFFERRFKDTSGIIRILTAMMTIFFLSWYLSSGLMSIGMVLESVFKIDYTFGLTVATAVVLIYTFIGGFVTVAWTDLFQALFLLGVILVVPFVALSHIDGGFGTIIATAQAKEIDLGIFENFSTDSLLTIIFLVLSWGLGYFGQPHIVTKFMGIKDASQMHKSKYVGMTWMLVALSAAIFVGLVGIAYFPNGLDNPELFFVEMVKSLFNPLSAGFILCGLLAASISTMDSQILVCASVLSEDVYKNLINKKATPVRLLFISRMGVVVVSILSLVVALRGNSTILSTVHYAWMGLGCAFGPLVLMSLYSNSTNRYGAIAGIVVGGTIAAGWHLANPHLTSYAIPAMIPGFFLSLLSISLVSSLTNAKQPVTAETPR